MTPLIGGYLTLPPVWRTDACLFAHSARPAAYAPQKSRAGIYAPAQRRVDRLSRVTNRKLDPKRCSAILAARGNPMIELRPFDKLGKSNHGWLNANFHFSFAEYRDPKRVHWGALRVWNNDRIAPNSGFPPHPHRDMEIVTYVIKGAITPSGPSRQPGPHRSGPDPGDERGQRHPARRVQQGERRDRAVPDLDPAQQGGRAGALGDGAVSGRRTRRQAGAAGLGSRP